MIDTLQGLAADLGIAEPFGRGFLSVLLTFFTALAFTWMFIPRLLKFALEKGWADQPNERRLNVRPLPNAGGLAIFAGFVVSLVVAWAMRPIIIQDVNIQVLAILLGGSWLVLVGFIDDQFGLSPLVRLLVQTLAAALLMVNGLMIDFNAIPFLSVVPESLNGPLSALVTWLWVVGLTNAVNLLDGVDGVVGGVAFVASMVLLVTAAQFPDRAAAVILLAGLAGSTLGYLRHNFNPSHIIMGDAGSTLLGFTLAAVSLLGTVKATASASVLLPLLVLALPIVDTTQVVVGRLARGIRNPLAHPDKTHIHHRVLARTASARKTALTLWALSLGFGLLGMAAQGVDAVPIVVTGLGVAGLLVAVAYTRVLAHRRELGRAAEQASQEEA
ncbi:undecaprenyl-phosphate alpha-N-acetylglucosaminyl 1-phosphate transferase [Deinococcus piscis]|uniref:Undecaprenyl-phosphate alpha-N-acetylglucosaminyl 1-phosphate transferase n=1 Tax=Deinococcus piscis TaxID=394230 RepID=A0ABQ3K0U7_9DEIO|nr:undecaprenyl-phosphate alpha-N-acetylglucosaminyl 1-phosphate transferase [Deinococcus piscis]